MADAQSLSFAFMRAHPSQAARVLEAVPEGDAAALFARAPVRLGVPVLAAMSPAAAARNLARLDDERAMELLGALGVQPAVAMLRYIAEPRRARLVSGLPTAAAFASRTLLGHAEDAVGAWTDPDVVALSAETSVGEALERVRSVQGYADEIFVIGPEQRFLGRAGLAELLRAAHDARLGALATRADLVLAVHTPLAAAAQHPGWSERSALPVVQPGTRLVGVLSRAALLRARARLGGGSAAAPAATLAGALARGYWEALAGLLAAAVTLLPAVRAVDGLHGGGDERS
jgi:magnesium transporter